jgi:hypothetical protein
MKTLIILLLLFNNNLELPELTYLRMLYVESPKSEEKAKKLIELTEKFTKNATMKGYCGAGKIAMAKHYSNPFSKLKTFNKGKELLESAIHTEPENSELRFLRLGIQKNVPTFLGYNKNIEQDKKFLINNLASIKDEEMKTIIETYLKTLK